MRALSRRRMRIWACSSRRGKFGGGFFSRPHFFGCRWPAPRRAGGGMGGGRVFGGEGALTFAHLGASGAAANAGDDWVRPDFTFPENGFSLEAAIDKLVARAVEQAGGNVSAAARLLGVSRDVVRYRMR